MKSGRSLKTIPRGVTFAACIGGSGGPLFFQVTPHPMKFPISADDLVDELDKFVPEYVPQAGDSMDLIQRNAGKRELVLFLKRLREHRDREVTRAATKGRR